MMMVVADIEIATGARYSYDSACLITIVGSSAGFLLETVPMKTVFKV